jgi:hypothetical protein
VTAEQLDADLPPDPYGDGGLPPDPLVDADLPTDLEELRADLARKVDRGTITLPVPGRDHWQIVLHLNVNPRQYERWTERARNKRTKRVDVYALGQVVLANHCTDLLYKGRPLGYTVRDPEFMSLVDVDARSQYRTREAVAALFGSEENGFDLVATFGGWAKAANIDIEEEGDDGGEGPF